MIRLATIRKAAWRVEIVLTLKQSSRNTVTMPLDSLDFTARRSYAIKDEDWRPLQIGETDIPGYFWIPLSEDEGGGWSSYWMKIQPGA